MPNTTMESIEQIPIPEIKLVYSSKIKPSERPRITCSKDAYHLFLTHWDTDIIEMQEEFKVMLLNSTKRVMGILHLSKGSITQTIADPKLILTAALLAGVPEIMLAHNHPSGSLRPSREDEALTKTIKSAAQFLQIKVLDHLIITSEGFYSFADEGDL